MTAISIANITSLGYVKSENINVTNNVLSFPLPLCNTDANTAINIMGKVRNIIITGDFTGTESVQAAFIADIEEWINTGIQERRIYTSRHNNQYYVICTDFNWTTEEGVVGHMSYTMTLVEANVLSVGT